LSETELTAKQRNCTSALVCGNDGIWSQESSKRQIALAGRSDWYAAREREEKYKPPFGLSVKMRPYPITILIFLASVLQTMAANYYVTQSGTGNRDGSSAANAWAVSDFNATTKPTGGDTVFFSGTLSTGLNPSANGTSGAQLLLDLKGATVSTTVTINSKSYLTLSGGTTASSMTSGTAIKPSSCNYLTVDKWTFNSSDINGWPTFAYSSYCTNLTFSNCTVSNCGYAFLSSNDKTVLITGCDVISSQNGTTNAGNQTDLVHLGGAQNVTIEKSKIVLRAPGSASSGSDGSYRHNDVIQTFATGGTST